MTFSTKNTITTKKKKNSRAMTTITAFGLTESQETPKLNLKKLGLTFLTKDSLVRLRKKQFNKILITSPIDNNRLVSVLENKNNKPSEIILNPISAEYEDLGKFPKDIKKYKSFKRNYNSLNFDFEKSIKNDRNIIVKINKALNINIKKINNIKHEIDDQQPKTERVSSLNNLFNNDNNFMGKINKIHSKNEKKVELDEKLSI